jgi:hypothetical protein
MTLVASLERTRHTLPVAHGRRSAPAVKAPRRRLLLEQLEDRTVPSAPVDSLSVRSLVGATDTLSSIQSVALPTNDLVYDSYDGMVYASVPGSAGTVGNTLTEINPVTGQVVGSFFVDNEPGKLAVSADGQFIYMGLQGAPNVLRFNVPDQEVDQTIPLGSGSFGSKFAEDIQVAPDDPTTVAVSEEFHGVSPRHAGVFIFTGGVELPNSTPGFIGSNSLAFGATGGRLYGYDNETTEFGFRRMNVDANGVTVQDVTGGLISGFNVTIKYDPGTGLAYATDGSVIDPEADGGPQLLGTYGTGFASSLLPDSATGRTYALVGNQLQVYDQARFNLVESFTLPAGGGSLIRWGNGDLAYRSGSQVYLLTLTATSASLATTDQVYDPSDGMIYASVPGNAGAAGNTLTEINPNTGRVVGSFFVGSNPGKLAVSADGQFIYVGLQGAPNVVRFNVPLQGVDQRFSLGRGQFGLRYAEDIAVSPDDPTTVAVAEEYHGVSPRHAGVFIFTGGVQLPNSTPGFIGSNSIAFGATGGRLYGYDNETTEFGFRRMNVDANGVTIQDVTGGLVGAFNVTIKYDRATGLVYTTNGMVIDPEAAGGPQVVGAYSGTGFASSVVVDSANDRVYFLTGSQLLVYDEINFTLIESFNLPAGGGSLVEWGAGELAYRSSDQVYFLTLTPI